MAEAAVNRKNVTDWIKDNQDQVIPWAMLVGLMIALISVFWNDLDSRGVYKYWDNPKYSHGYLVPVFTLILLWMRYEPFKPVKAWERWAGFALLAGGIAVRMVATYLTIPTIEMMAFVPSAVGVFLMVGGLHMLRWAGPAVAFLIFMFPLPSFLDSGLLAPMQKIATRASTYVLQTMGVPSYAEGNIIYIGEMQLGVVEACSGLRMLTIFIALSFAIVLVTDRPLWERIVIVLSSIPIALVSNIVRIVVTALLYMVVPEWVDKVFHDLDGWLMMPFALGLLYVEFQVLSHLIIEEDQTGPLQVT